MPKPDTHAARIARIEQLHKEMAKKVDSLLDMQAINEERFAATSRQLRETDLQIRELGRQTDERIDKLVIAIGALIRKMDERA